MARWRSGYVEDCKSSHAGSIPARASNLLFALPALPPVSAIQQAKCAALAQSVEHIIRNDGVRGSNPLSGTIPLSREMRDMRTKGPSAGKPFASWLFHFGQGGGISRLKKTRSGS